MQHLAIYAGIALLLAFSLYRKGRRMIGERAFDRRRTWMRLLFLAAAFAFVLWIDAQQVDAGLADPRAAMMMALPFLLLGIVGGVGLGVVAARMAQFRIDAGLLKVRAHALFGPAILALYVLRVAYKFWLFHHLGIVNGGIGTTTVAGMHTTQQALAHYDVDPLGTLLRALFFAYYLSYYGLLLRKARQPAVSSRPAS
ncbi:MAG: hypothetical protein KGH73_01760 [Xanthomonadaceae bacterium]|nr:hypothetical protein [Xanthomonadaceae bacterium]